MTAAVDYLGRVFDVLALRGATPVGDTLLDQSMFDVESSGEICTGVQKLAQRWVLELLTISGSMTYWPDRGTDFVQRLRQGNFVSELDVITEFNFAKNKVARNLRNEETDNMNDEDRYFSAELISVLLLDGFLAMTVTITSLAGENRKVVLPISILPVKIGL